MTSLPDSPTLPAATLEAAASAPPDAVMQASRAAAVATLLLLIGLGLGWELAWAPTGRGTLALKVLPLVLPLPGLLKMRLYTYRWVSLVIWLYFIEGAVRGYAATGPTLWLAWGEVVLCVLLFAACTLHVRWRLAQARKAAGGRP